MKAFAIILCTASLGHCADPIMIQKCEGVVGTSHRVRSADIDEMYGGPGTRVVCRFRDHVEQSIIVDEEGHATMDPRDFELIERFRGFIHSEILLEACSDLAMFKSGRAKDILTGFIVRGACNGELYIQCQGQHGGWAILRFSNARYGVVNTEQPLYHSNERGNRRPLVVSSSFGPSLPLRSENLYPPTPGEPVRVLPNVFMTRFLSGDVRPEWIVGLGRFDTAHHRPAEGYKDVFVSDLVEYERVGIHWDPKGRNDPVEFATKLSLSDELMGTIRRDGAWLLLVPAAGAALIPTDRHNPTYNAHYREGGFTQNGMQEWVTRNIEIAPGRKPDNVEVYRLLPGGETIRYIMFRGNLVPESQLSETIGEHMKTVVPKPPSPLPEKRFVQDFSRSGEPVKAVRKDRKYRANDLRGGEKEKRRT
jgi:hypothetical protein